MRVWNAAAQALDGRTLTCAWCHHKTDWVGSWTWAQARSCASWLEQPHHTPKPIRCEKCHWECIDPASCEFCGEPRRLIREGASAPSVATGLANSTHQERTQ